MEMSTTMGIWVSQNYFPFFFKFSLHLSVHAIKDSPLILFCILTSTKYILLGFHQFIRYFVLCFGALRLTKWQVRTGQHSVHTPTMTVITVIKAAITQIYLPITLNNCYYFIVSSRSRINPVDSVGRWAYSKNCIARSIFWHHTHPGMSPEDHQS